jgi:flavin-dependent dehydrogenase
MELTSSSSRRMSDPLIGEADVIVVGSGPAGGAAALTLAQQGARIILVEKQEFRHVQVGENLPASARPLLQSLGVWERFKNGGHLPCYGARSAWGMANLVESTSLFNPYGHGWHLDRPAFDKMLTTAAEEAGATRIVVSRVLGWRPCGSGGNLQMQRGRETLAITASAVVDCSGRAAVVARGLGVGRDFHDKLIAVAAVCRPHAGGDSDTTMTIESVSDGWWYSAPLTGGHRVLVFLSDGDLLDARAAAEPTDWCRRLNRTEHLRRMVKRFNYQPIERPVTLTACSSRLTQVFGETWVCAGDSAVSFDPLSSMGLLTALSSGRRAASVILETMSGNQGAARDYASTLKQLYEDYLRSKLQYYSLERRWPQALFWKRRHNANCQA